MKHKLVTLLDREPNYFFDIFIKHNLKTFKSSDLVIILNLVDPNVIKSSLKTRYNIDSNIVTEIEDITKCDTCVIYKPKNNSDINEYDKLINIGNNHINNVQNVLIEHVDTVVFLDMDELLYHENLLELLNKNTSLILRPIGTEIIQHPHNEKTLDLNIPIYKQRSYIRYFNSKNKPIITKRKVSWDVGRHSCDGVYHGDVARGKDCTPGLYLINLDKLDVNRLFQLKIDSLEMYTDLKLSFDDYTNWLDESSKDIFEDKIFIEKLGL